MNMINIDAAYAETYFDTECQLKNLEACTEQKAQKLHKEVNMWEEKGKLDHVERHE